MELGIRGKTALVLGARGGLGRAIAAAFAKEGAQLAVADIRDELLTETVREAEKAGVKGGSRLRAV